MLGREYSANMGFLPFLIGFGQMRQQVKAQEAGMQAQADQQLYGGLGQGVGNLVNAYAQRSGQLQDMDMAQANRMAFQTAQNRNDVYEQVVQDSLKRGFGPPPTSAAQVESQYGGAPMATPVLDAYRASQTEFAQSQAPQFFGPPTGRIPMPINDPSLTGEHQQALKQETEMLYQKRAMDLNPNIPDEERAAATTAMAPYLARARQITQRYPQQRPPTPQELAQQGMVPGTMNTIIPNGKGGYSNFKMTPEVRTPTTPAEIEADVRARTVTIDGDKFIRQPDGKITPVKDTDGGDGFKWDENKEYESAEKAIIAQHKDEETPYVPSNAEINFEMDKKRRALVGRTQGEKQNELDSLAKALRDVKRDYPGGPSTMPPAMVEAYEQWKKEYASLGGK